jgi:hypothetical protein
MNVCAKMINNRLIYQSVERLLVAVILSMFFVLLGCRANTKMDSLPVAVAEILAIEPLDSGFTDRYIVYVKREAYKANESIINEENILRCWRTRGSGLEACTAKQMLSDGNIDFFSKTPVQRSYIDFIVRKSESESIVKILFLESYIFRGGINEYYELTMKWTGTKWEKESIKKHPYPMPTD